MIVGSGGREHALVEALAASPLEPEMHAVPGNPGIARIAQVADIPADDLIALRDYATEREIDLTVVGPESPLIGGIAEAFWDADLKIFGPSRAAARIEGSKIFAKELMHHAGVPTARSEAFDGETAALAHLRRLNEYPVVVKADGVAAGKGVTVAHSREEAEGAVRAAFAGKFGAAGERILIEECLEGREASVFVVTDGQEILPFLPAQDYKRIYDGDEGPNTGGMGAYSPLMWMEPATYATILEEIVRPTIHQLALIGAPYTGLLYAGVMVTETGPKALEFNCRFGDPETQVILPRLGTDLLELMIAAEMGDIAGREVTWSADKAVCVVLASEGYPESSSS
ncbi:MAG: phosphoribosylamine--glycine ligase, partial [Actinobacteria bacterium]|nr:phosphoribosylamine--glycine ligase [Actinomycetota bacterium]